MRLMGTLAKSFKTRALIAATLSALFFLAACNRDPNVAKQKYVAKGNDYYS